MSSISRPIGSLDISDRLRNPLREIARRQWIVAAAVGTLQTLAFALVVLLAGALLLGSFEKMPRVLRVPVAFGPWLAAAWIAARFLPSAFRRWSLARSAMHVEASLPGMHERLSSAVELAGETDDRFRGSAALMSHLFRQAEKDAGKVDPEKLVGTAPIKRWGIYLAPVVIAWAMMSLLYPRPVEAGLYRLFHPWSAALPVSLSKLAVSPGDITLAQGDDLDITAKLSRDTVTTPGELASLLIKYPSGQVTSKSMGSPAEKEFETKLTDLQQGFQYMVRTDAVESGWFTATVNPRPGVASLDLGYEYPPYTSLPPKRVGGSDGTIEAIAGTKVTLTIHATGPLADSADHKNQILIDEGKTTQSVVPLTPLTGNDYQAALIVTHSGQYRVQLCNSFGLTNKDDQPRNIIAHFDQPPRIAILSPTASESVRPDDIVPVKYLATDDFGIASIDMIVQADENPPETHRLRLPAQDHREIKQTLTLSVASIIARSGLPDVNHITYQLKVIDNRDPDPQSSFSAKQTLIVERYGQSIDDKQDEHAIREMHRALEKATQQLNEAEQKSASLRNNDPNNPMTDQNRDNAHAAEQKLAEAAQELHDQAQQQEDTPFADVAKKADEIADQQIQKAAEDAAKAELAADRPDQRIADAAAAQEQIAAARDKLQQLNNQLEDARRQAQAARDLRQAARLQQQAAEGFENHPEKTAANQEKERQAMQKLQDAMNRDPALRDNNAQQVAQRLADLANRIGDLQNQQTRQQAQSAKQQQLAQAQNQSNQLADQQKKLNNEIQHFAQQEKTPLDAVHAQPPAPDQENNLVAELKRNDLDNAAAQMKQQADQLHQDARQLQQQADAHDPQHTADQQAAEQQDQQNARQADQDKNQANQAADELAQQAQQPQAPDANNAAEQHVAQAAQAIEQQADALHSDNPAAQHEAEAAHHDAELAAQEAQAAEHAATPNEAKHDLSKASHELRQAGEKLSRAANDKTAADQAEANAQDREAAHEAAEQAKELADEQKALAQAADQERPAVAQARDNAEPAQQAAQEQQQLADQAQQAGQQAAALQQQAQQNADTDVAHRAEETQHALQQAAGEQQQAAQAEQHDDAAHAAEHQEAAQQDLAQAQSDLRGLQQAEQANADQPHPQTPQEDNLNEQHHPDSDQGQADPGQAANHAQHHAHSDDQANADQGQPEVGQPDSDQPNQASSETPEQGREQAARRAQEAAAVQPQALQPNAQAAQEAANALQQAVAANTAAQPGQPHAGQPEDSKTSGQEPGKPGQPFSIPLPALNSTNGIAMAQGSATAPPESVRALGISAGDWARLPTLMRNELMNAAQQSGPPTYREMIKNYYVRIAREQAAAGSAGAMQQ